MNSSKKNQSATVRLIRRKEVEAKTGLSPSSIYALMKEDKFPKAIKLSIRRVAWIETEIDVWIFNRLAKSLTSQCVEV